ncbi:hypothetical protein [Streptomyces sp. CA-106131]|uniref:hypothetical protein n=1 Tax=Streptomyces sp. CA-106131 TaxID=3240045 RepID=UPI003D8CBA5F
MCIAVPARCPARWRSVGFDLLLAVCCLAVSIALAAVAGRSQPDARPVDALAYAGTAVCCGLVALRRRHALGVLAACGAVLALFVLRTCRDSWMLGPHQPTTSRLLGPTRDSRAAARPGA